jgi:spore germination protein YaaH
MRTSQRTLLSAVAILVSLAPTVAASASNPSPVAAPTDTRAHVVFDDTHSAPLASLRPGAAATALLRPKMTLGDRTAIRPGSTSSQVSTTATAPADPEVLGFAQSGEVAGGAWRSDLRFDLLSTIAYFGINLNGDGSMVTSDSGYQTWRSSETTALIDTAHQSGDRVVLTVKAFGSTGIQTIVGSEVNRQSAIRNILGELQGRGGDGVNVDFEGSTPTVQPADFVTFVSELQYALRAAVPAQSYLTVDTYASAALGGEMWDLQALRPYVDAFDVMAYDIHNTGSANAGPVAPLNGDTFSDTSIVADYLAVIPPQQIILGVPYYGYKWNVTTPSEGAPTTGGASADTYSAVTADLACASMLTEHFDATYDTPWATWFSPATADPCGGNHNSWRELFYDNAQSLGGKYDLVNARGLRGIGIWALGYDSGHTELWSEIQTKFSVQHSPGGVATPSGPPDSLGGGPLGGRPYPVSSNSGQNDVFWRGQDGGIWHSWRSSGAWSGSLPMADGIIASDPHPVSWGGGRIDLFWRGQDGQLWHQCDCGGAWRPVESLGDGPLASDPVPVSWGSGRLDVFWKGADGNLWHTGYNGVSWTAPQMIGAGPLGSDPQPVSWGPGHLDVFWHGLNGGIWHTYSADGVTWSGAKSLGYGPMSNAPTAVSSQVGVVDLFWRGNNGQLWHAFYSNGWHGPESLGGVNVGQPSAVSRLTGAIDVFWTGTGGSLDHKFYSGGWYGPFSMGDGPLGGSPFASTWGGGHIDVFWKGADGGLWHAGLG